jgi:hypothetical protein
MFQEVSVWNIILLLSFTRVNMLPFTLDTVVSVSVSVLERYHSKSVYLLHSAHQHGECHGYGYVYGWGAAVQDNLED